MSDLKPLEMAALLYLNPVAITNQRGVDLQHNISLSQRQQSQNHYSPKRHHGNDDAIFHCVIVSLSVPIYRIWPFLSRSEQPVEHHPNRHGPRLKRAGTSQRFWPQRQHLLKLMALRAEP